MDYYYQYQYCFDVSRQLAERGEACLLRLSLAHARGGSQDEERVLTTAPSPSPSPSPSRWTCSSSIGVRLPEAYCTVVSSLLDLPKRRRAKCKVHTSTNCSTSRRGKEPSARFYRSCRPSRSMLQLQRMMLLYDAAMSPISKVVPPFFSKSVLDPV